MVERSDSLVSRYGRRPFIRPCSRPATFAGGRGGSVGYGGAAALETLIRAGRLGSGDRDGPFDRALPRHVQGIANDGRMPYVTDTYNHRIKTLGPETRTIRAAAGADGRGSIDGPLAPASFD